MKAWLALLTCVLQVSAFAQTQTVWRCGPDGRSYSDTPCPAGRELRLDDSRNGHQMQDAREVARREQALAQALARERQSRERSWAGPSLAGIKPTAPAEAQRPEGPKKPPPRKSTKPKRDAAADTWTSTAPASPRKPG